MNTRLQKANHRKTKSSAYVYAESQSYSDKWLFKTIEKEEGVIPGSIQNLRWDLEVKGLRAAKSTVKLLIALDSVIEGISEFSVNVLADDLNGDYIVSLHTPNFIFTLEYVMKLSRLVAELAERFKAEYFGWQFIIPSRYSSSDDKIIPDGLE